MQISGTPELVIQKDITACVPVEPPVVTMTFANASTATAPMTNIGGTLFQVTFPGPFPPGTALMRADVDCPPDTAGYPASQALVGPEDVIEIGNIIFFDPSGTILNACTGGPLSGATVTLLKDDGAGNFVVPPTADHIPTTNPQTTAANGSYGWVVVSGTYKVQATKAGYTSAIVGPFVIPPPVTGADMTLTPIGGCPAGGAVGGFVDLPVVAATPRDSSGSGTSYLYAGMAAAAAVFAAAYWYGRRRRIG